MRSDMPFWYRSLEQAQRDELKREHTAAKDAGKEEFQAIGHKWNTKYVSYLYQYLETADAKNKR